MAKRERALVGDLVYLSLSEHVQYYEELATKAGELLGLYHDLGWPLHAHHLRYQLGQLASGW